MKLEVNKSYKTRGGWRAKVVADDLGGLYYRILAVHYRPLVPIISANHTSYGMFELSGASDYDLISEWVDPPKPVEVWVICEGDKPLDFCRTEHDAIEECAGYQDANPTGNYTVKHMREVVGE